MLPLITPISPPMSPPHNPHTPRCHLHITGTHDHMTPRFVRRLDNDKNPTRRHAMKVVSLSPPKSQGCRSNKTLPNKTQPPTKMDISVFSYAIEVGKASVISNYHSFKVYELVRYRESLLCQWDLYTNKTIWVCIIYFQHFVILSFQTCYQLSSWILLINFFPKHPC